MAATAYQKFIARHVRGSRGAKQTRSRFKAAVRAWRSKGKSSGKRKSRSRRNPVLPGVDFGPSMVYNRGVYRAKSGRYAKRGLRPPEMT